MGIFIWIEDAVDYQTTSLSVQACANVDNLGMSNV